MSRINIVLDNYQDHCYAGSVISGRLECHFVKPKKYTGKKVGLQRMWLSFQILQILWSDAKGKKRQAGQKENDIEEKTIAQKLGLFITVASARFFGTGSAWQEHVG